MSAPHAVAGVVGKAFGLAGEAFVWPDPDVRADFRPGARFAAGTEELVVASSRLHSGRLLLRFAGVDSRDAVERLRGVELTVPRDALRLDADAHWVDELVGRAVVDEAGTHVGTVTAVTDGAAHDYLVVSTSTGDRLVPAVDELVDVTGECVVVHPVPGLLDDAAEEA